MTGRHTERARLFRAIMAERRQYPRGSMEWAWRDRAALKLAQGMLGVPAIEWVTR